MLKAAVVGGPSLVFTRKHVAGKTRIRTHKHKEANIVKRILGFNANSLYPSTMEKEMPCGQEFVEHYKDPVQAAQKIIGRMYSKRWFGFAEVDIEVPRDLWEVFEEFPPIFINQSEITAVYRTINYVPKRIFYWFVQEVANMRRKGDAEADKALLAEIYKLLGNSAYGKFIEAVERQTKVLYTKDEDEVDKHMRSAYFEDLEEIGDAYKIESRKKEVTIDRPFQVGIVVYQLAKLRMLQFYYDFLDKYIDRRYFELIQMDTDSFYLSLSHDTLEAAVKPELLQEFEREKTQRLSWDKWSSREPGLFKLEKEGTRDVALCSKCYFVDDENSGKTKISSKGVSQKQNMPPPKPGSILKLKQDHNEQIWKRYDMALDGHKDMATNRGFRMKDGTM